MDPRANAAALALLLLVGLVGAPRDASAREPAAPSANDVVAPVLATFVDAPYPDDAKANGLEGTVTLALDIDVDGNVTNAVVKESAGHGFDEAAVAAAKRFVFEPAKRGGKPIAARILYAYAFTLTSAPASAVPPATPAGRLQGVTRVASSEGLPLDGAKVVVEDARGRSITLTTKADGSWSVDGLPPGKVHVTVVAEGYEPFAADEDVADAQATEVTYRVKPKSDGVAEITVRGEPPPREVTRREISRREMSRIPGTNGDALKSIQSLPGVARAPGLAGLLIVRGSAPQDSQIFVDGTPVPIVYHFGAFSSVLPTETIEKLDFYPGNFGVQYGRAMGGVIDVKLREADVDGKYHGLAQVDLIDARLMARGPVPFAKGWTFLAGARRSHVDAWIGPILESTGAGVTSAPVYYDYQAFLETKPTSSSRFRIGYFGSDDRLELFVKSPNESEPALAGDIGFHTGFGRVQALYENQLDARLRFKANVAYGYDATQLNAGQLAIRIHTNPLTSRAEMGFKAADWLTFNVGEDVTYANARVEVRAPPPPRPGEASGGPANTRGFLVQDTSIDIVRPAAYADMEFQPLARWRVVAGGRFDYASDTQKWDPSVRASTRVTLRDEFPKTVAKAGWGQFYQPPQPQETDNVFGSKGLRSNASTHTSFGAEQEITKQIDVSLEGYYKDLTSIVSRVPTANGSEYFNSGSGNVYGMELLLRYKPDDRFFGWIAYTLSRSERRLTDGEGLTLFQYDQPHILTALASYKLGKGWEVGGRFRFVSGNLYTPCNGIGGVYDSAAGGYQCISGQAFSKRLPPFHQLDVRVDKTWDFDAWKLSAYLDLYNAYVHQSPEDVSWNYNYSRSTYQSGLPIIPSFGIRGEF